MENNITEEQNKKPHTTTPIYSKMAVLGFCLFFNPIFGGILLRKNLMDIGEDKAGLIALLFSAFLFMISAIIGTSLLKGFSGIYVCNLIGGAIMVEYFYRKYFPQESEHPKKSIVRPLLISLAVSLLLLIILISSGAKLPH